jgi:uncharacterized protein (TIGR02996 family)
VGETWADLFCLCEAEVCRVLRDNPDVPLRRVVAFETGIPWYDWQGLLVYADWLAENGCPTREAEVREDVADYRRLMTRVRDNPTRPEYWADTTDVLAEMAAAGV